MGGATLDPLTGLLNRTTLEQRFEEIRQQAMLTDEPVALLLFDLDRFKAVNDRHGHDVGDAVLRHVSYELRKALRSFELAYRLGGEELLVLLPGATLEDGVTTAERVRGRVAAARPGGIGVTLSAGVSAEIGAVIDYRRMFVEADARLYRAKHDGRNHVMPLPAPGASAPIHARRRLSRPGSPPLLTVA